MANFLKSELEEQETYIWIDYFEAYVYFYTCRKELYYKLIDKLGTPNEQFMTKAKISGGTWKLPFNERNLITSILSRPLLIGNINNEKSDKIWEN